ncbi:hypothetical protein [Desulfobacter hydrogenophilus]|uniref:hypothetical protein n=1 Tax=Desulfobacter hydrogenophilus TaxID=2291 RepID=UPI003BF834CA
MSQPGGFLGQITIVEFRVAAAHADDFHIGKAEPHTVDADQHLVGIGFGDGKKFGLIIPADVLFARAIHIPGPGFFR